MSIKVVFIPPNWMSLIQVMGQGGISTFKTCYLKKKKNTYNFYLVIEVRDHVYVFYAYRLYFADKDIYMIRYFYHKIEIVRVFINSIAFGIGHTRSTKRYNTILY
jgi:hypothetical protein